MSRRSRAAVCHAVIHTAGTLVRVNRLVALVQPFSRTFFELSPRESTGDVQRKHCLLLSTCVCTFCFQRRCSFTLHSRCVWNAACFAESPTCVPAYTMVRRTSAYLAMGEALLSRLPPKPLPIPNPAHIASAVSCDELPTPAMLLPSSRSRLRLPRRRRRRLRLVTLLGGFDDVPPPGGLLGDGNRDERGRPQR